MLRDGRSCILGAAGLYDGVRRKLHGSVCDIAIAGDIFLVLPEGELPLLCLFYLVLPCLVLFWFVLFDCFLFRRGC